MVVVLLCVWWWQCGGGDQILKVRVMRTDSNYNECKHTIIDSRQIESVSTEVSKACRRFNDGYDGGRSYNNGYDGARSSYNDGYDGGQLVQ